MFALFNLIEQLNTPSLQIRLIKLLHCVLHVFCRFYMWVNPTIKWYPSCFECKCRLKTKTIQKNEVGSQCVY